MGKSGGKCLKVEEIGKGGQDLLKCGENTSTGMDFVQPWYIDLLDLWSSGLLVLPWHIISYGGFRPVWYELQNTSSGFE